MSIKKSKITYKKYLKLIENQEMNPFEFITVSYKKGLHVWSGKYEDRKKKMQMETNFPYEIAKNSLLIFIYTL
jgi:hypothetical protein